MYLDLEIQLLKQIQELKKRANFIAIKSEYEAEGADNTEIQYVQSLSKKLGIKHYVKIGGVEAKNDIYNCIKSGVDGIIAPMVESRFGMKKFITAIKDFKTSKKPYLAINIETKNAIENIIDILKESKGNINGATIGRSDLAASYFSKKITPNSNFITNQILNILPIIKKHKLVITIGGKIDVNTLKIYRKNKKIFKNVNQIETRKIIFNTKTLLNNTTLLKKALMFEKTYLKTINQFSLLRNETKKQRLKFLTKRY